MPYVPSEKTDGKSQDRNVLDDAIEVLAKEAAGKITNNLSLIFFYNQIFVGIGIRLHNLLNSLVISKFDPVSVSPESQLASTIYELGKSYGYEGAFLGELNYSITRFIQRVPQIKVERKEWKDEIRYWLYAATVEALTSASAKTESLKIGVSGVFEDVKDEYKRRVNTSYEAAQILKSGDCYDTPYYTRLVEVVDDGGVVVGHQEVMLKRSDKTLKQDTLDYQIVLKRKSK